METLRIITGKWRHSDVIMTEFIKIRYNDVAIEYQANLLLADKVYLI